MEIIRLPSTLSHLAPDGSEIRLLPTMKGGGLCECWLAQGAVSIAKKHRVVEEIWYFQEGYGLMWRKSPVVERIDDVQAGVALTIPAGVSFQFRNTGLSVLKIVIVTMPPWTGEQEALDAERKWDPTLVRPLSRS